MTNPIAALLDDLRAKLPAASKIIVEGATAATTSQSALTGPAETVRRVVEGLPNSSDHFPSRESYLGVGYAIKAALPDDDATAFELYADWCGRWADGVNDLDIVAADWARMKPPFKQGFAWLCDKREEITGASVWWEAVDAELFPVETSSSGDVYPMLRLSDLLDRAPPVWLLRRHIPAVCVGFLYSVPGAGKSFVALDIALHIAFELGAWHGDELAVPPGAVVLYIAAEGSYGFRNRVKAWKKAHGISTDSDRFLMIEKTINFMKTEDIDRLLRTVHALGEHRPCLIVVDTVSRAMPGADENLQKEMTLFVAACDRLKEAFGCAVLGVHHAGKNGDMRGSTVLLGAGDFVFKLERKQGSAIGNLVCEKQKDAPDGWSEPYRFEKVEIGEGESSLVPSRAEMSAAPEVELTPALTVEVLDAMRTAWDSGLPWSRKAQAGERHAVRRMVADFGFSAASADDLVEMWAQTGVVRVEMVSSHSRTKGLRVVGSVSLPPTVGVFD